MNREIADIQIQHANDTDVGNSRIQATDWMSKSMNFASSNVSAEMDNNLNGSNNLKQNRANGSLLDNEGSENKPQIK